MIFFSLLISVPTSSASLANNSAENLKSLQNKHRDHIAHLNKGAATLIKNKFQGSYIVELCKVQISDTKEPEYFLGLVSSDHKKELLMAVIYANGHYDAQKAKSAPGSFLQNPSEMELQCLSAGEIKERNQSITETEGVGGKILSNGKGVGCVSFTAEQTSFDCFYYSPKTKKLQSAGGWET